MKGLLSRIGYKSTEDPFSADFIMLVTCSIREKAVDKVYSELGRIRPFIEENPNLIVGVSGCVAQQEKQNLIKRFPFVDMVFGPDAISELPQMVEKIQSHKQQGIPTHLLNTKFHSRQNFEFVNLLYEGEENRVKAYVNIQKGCDNVCSFCIVPYVRGAEVSRPSAAIIREVQALEEMGVKDVTLLGQNVNSYGLKNSQELSFAELLEAIAKNTNIPRIRFTTSHPKDVGDDLIDKFKNISQLAPHFHLPVQSGSDRILNAMKRQYTVGDYLTIIRKLQKVRPELVFTTDVIVGFPGETEDDFTETLKLLDEVQFDMTYSFIYSPRPKTKAAQLVDNVEVKTKKERLNVLIERQRKISAQKNLSYLGSAQEVLVENFDGVSNNWTGRTPTNKVVHFKVESVVSGESETGRKDLTGTMVPIKITKTHPHSLLGEYHHD